MIYFVNSKTLTTFIWFGAFFLFFVVFFSYFFLWFCELEKGARKCNPKNEWRKLLSFLSRVWQLCFYWWHRCFSFCKFFEGSFLNLSFMLETCCLIFCFAGNGNICGILWDFAVGALRYTFPLHVLDLLRFCGHICGYHQYWVLMDISLWR